MTLHRDTPPRVDDGWIEIGADIAVSVSTPRELQGISIPELLADFERACAAIWGHHWRAPVETVFGLSRGATKEWQRREQIPPPMILGWVAYIVTRDDRRAVGAHLLGWGHDPSGEAHRVSAAISASMKGN